MTRVLHPWLQLARVSNLPTVWTNVLAAWLISGGAVSDLRLLWITLGASLLYTGGMILNDAADIAFDREHRPERPIPSGRIALRAAWSVGLLFLLCGTGLMIEPGAANLAVTVTLAVTILAYDLYHKPWSGSVVLMGACRTLLYLAAASPLVARPWSSPALIPGLVLGAYIVGLSLMARREAPGNRHAASAAWPFLLLLLSPALSSVGHVMQGADPRYAVLGIPVGLIYWTSDAVRRMRLHPPQSIGPAVGRLLAGIAWVDAAALAPSHPSTALLFVASVPLLLLWQKRIAAT